MSPSEADHPTDYTLCSSLKMQRPTGNYPLIKEKEIPGEELHLNVEPEQPQCGPENSNLDNVPWKLLATGPLGSMRNVESSSPQVQPQACGASAWSPPRSRSRKHSENQGNLLQFDRQAPGRISTSPTLRRLRGSMCGTSHSLPQQDTLEVPSWRSWKEPAGSPCCPSNSPPGSSKGSWDSLSPLSRSSQLPSDPEKALKATGSLEPQTRPSNKHALPVPLPISEGLLHQASPLRRDGCSSPSPSPRHPSPQGEGTHQSRFYEHRRSSVVLNLPGLEVFPGDLLVSAGAADYLYHPLLLLNSESKKPRWPFSKRGVQGKDKHKHIADLETCLSAMRIMDFRGYEFHSLKDKSWNEVVETHQKRPTDQLDCRKQQEAVWELFTSECTYFLDHLLVLKMVFMNTLKYLQTHEYLLDVDLWRLFANLEELSQTSLGFVNSFFNIVKDYVDSPEMAPSMDFISVLTKYFRGSLCQSHQTYCLNYSAAVFYLESLRQRDDFGIYLKCLKHIFKEHMAENILSPTNRHLLYEGRLTLAESTRVLDAYLFLFDDFLLVTKTKRNKKKLGGSDTGLMCPSLTPELQTVIKEGGSCTVLDQPILLDRLVVKNIDPLHISVFGLKNAFLIQHENRYRQCIAAFLLQAQTENLKKAWMAQITAAISCFTKSQKTKKQSLFTLSSESSEI
ncbi:pleckstrin homology domain-containing family G member 7 isoform X5 [Dasypus novemcinctus]|uniref:pleckstrin homology domain-containing family G member 7 isoform X5 n=1 Tax=Dasypus novemcinctus TaxID=9361 RepID=UPI00265EB107|nr:pleckstrin homology domain-containing family G member 7 isoform X5 [Dasypus novemcinctus]